jgi:Immunity protein 63
VNDVSPTDPVRAREVLEPTREVLEAEIGRLAALISATGKVVVGFDRHIDLGYPYIEIGAAGQLHWIVKERGLVLDRRTTRDPDELLYWSFQTTTFSLASDWEVRHRDESQDFRGGLRAKQAELLHRLNPNWAQRWLRELAARQPADIGLFPELPSDRPADTI